jgi:hypothetical protein
MAVVNLRHKRRGQLGSNDLWRNPEVYEQSAFDETVNLRQSHTSSPPDVRASAAALAMFGAPWAAN